VICKPEVTVDQPPHQILDVTPDAEEEKADLVPSTGCVFEGRDQLDRAGRQMFFALPLFLVICI